MHYEIFTQFFNHTSEHASFSLRRFFLIFACAGQFLCIIAQLQHAECHFPKRNWVVNINFGRISHATFWNSQAKQNFSADQWCLHTDSFQYQLYHFSSVNVEINSISFLVLQHDECYFPKWCWVININFSRISQAKFWTSTNAKLLLCSLMCGSISFHHYTISACLFSFSKAKLGR